MEFPLLDNHKKKFWHSGLHWYPISKIIAAVMDFYIKDEDKYIRDRFTTKIIMTNPCVWEYLIQEIEKLNGLNEGVISCQLESIEIPSDKEFFEKAFPEYLILKKGDTTISLGVLDRLDYNKDLEMFIAGNSGPESVHTEKASAAIKFAFHEVRIYTCIPVGRVKLNEEPLIQAIGIFQKEYMKANNIGFGQEGRICKETVLALNRALRDEWKREPYYSYNISTNKYAYYIDDKNASEMYALRDGRYLERRLDGFGGIWAEGKGHLKNLDGSIMSVEDFRIITSTLYAEMKTLPPYDWREPAAMFDVIRNCLKEPKVRNEPRTFIAVMAGIAMGYRSPVRNAWKYNAEDPLSKSAAAAKGVIIACLYPDEPYSQKAYFWDGADIMKFDKKKYPKNFNEHSAEWGIYYTDSSHDIYGTGNKLYPGQRHPRDPASSAENDHPPHNKISAFDHLLDSTAAYGGTIFWRYCRNAYNILKKTREWL